MGGNPSNQKEDQATEGYAILARARRARGLLKGGADEATTSSLLLEPAHQARTPELKKKEQLLGEKDRLERLGEEGGS